MKKKNKVDPDSKSDDGPSITEIFQDIVGPSSSHTAGAVAIGNAVFQFCGGKPPSKATFRLFNSFATTGFLHGTHNGLLAGTFGLKPNDERIHDAIQLATFEYEFIEIENDESRHPNEVEIVFDFVENCKKQRAKIVGQSLGGGFVKVEGNKGSTAVAGNGGGA
ncbi:MAG TPA: serine dehydratase beta chain [Pyrinomonadaceae bacterium]|jgi:L-serine dehydratase